MRVLQQAAGTLRRNDLRQSRRSCPLLDSPHARSTHRGPRVSCAIPRGRASMPSAVAPMMSVNIRVTTDRLGRSRGSDTVGATEGNDALSSRGTSCQEASKSSCSPGNPSSTCIPRDSRWIEGSDNNAAIGLEMRTSPGPASEEMRFPVATKTHSRSPRPRRRLVGVESDANVDADLPHLIADGARAQECIAWPLEPRKEAVVRCIQLRAREPRELPTDQLVVGGQDISPSMVSQQRHRGGRPHDVREHHRGASRSESGPASMTSMLVRRPQGSRVRQHAYPDSCSHPPLKHLPVTATAGCQRGPHGMAPGMTQPQYRELEAGRLHVSNDLYLRIVDVCGWR